MVERIVPAILSEGTKAEQAASKETARVQNTDENHCPICGQSFITAVANGHAVKTCLEHSIVMPTRD
jgi:RNA polymerase subunit RPABC4/transcription elongation factor Spt4